jgi:hypothetical protein
MIVDSRYYRWKLTAPDSMKLSLIIAGLIVGCPFAGFTQGLVLHAGESYTYKFNTLPFQDSSVLGAQEAVFSVFLNTRILAPGDSLQMQMFEDVNSANLIFSRTLTSSSFPFDTICVVPNAWTDRNGSVRLTMIAGSVGIIDISLQTSVGSPRGFLNYGDIIYPVPEPGGLTLLVAGGVVWRSGMETRADEKIK